MAGFVRNKVLQHILRPAQCSHLASRPVRSRANQLLVVRAASPATLNYPPPQQQQSFSPSPAQSFYDNPAPGGGASKVFANFPLYKGKAAAQVQILSPTFKATAQGNYYVDRPGSVFIEFADVVQGSGTSPGERRYDWGNKQTFALSAVEFSGLVEPAAQSYLHDPQRGGPNQGQTIKTLKFQPAGTEGDWFLSVDVRKDGGNTRITLPVSKNELAALRTLSITVVPHLLGLDEVMNRGIYTGPEEQSQPPF